MDGVEGKEIEDFECGLRRELENCRDKCLELETASKKAEERCVVLESEVQKKKSEFELLEGRFEALAVEKLAIEDKLGVLQKKNDELQEQITRIENVNSAVSEGEKGMGRIVNLCDNDEEEKIFQLMIENKVLECEKKKAESEVDIWKVKFKELESRVLKLETTTLLLRGEERHFPGKMMEEGPELPEMGMKEMNGSRGLKDGLDVATSSTHLQSENKMVDSNKIIRSATGVITTSYLSGKGIEDLQASGTPPVGSPCKQFTHVERGQRGILCGSELEYGKRVRKQLAFEEEGNLNKKMAPSTPGGARPTSVGVIDISDSDGEPDYTMLHMPTPYIQGNRMVSVSSGCALGGTMRKKEFSFNKNLNNTLLDQSDEEDTGGYKGTFAFTNTSKRKRPSNIVTTDSESDDDNVPISKLKTKHLPELNTDSHLNSHSVTVIVSADKVKESVSRRRLVTRRKCEEGNGPKRSSPSPSNLKTSETKRYPGIPTNEDVEADNMEDDGPDSEGESLGGFIVDSSGVSDSDDTSGESEDASDDNMDFKEIISRIQRNRDHNLKWEFEADMLAAFGKDPELCMKAVCALYRQQTSEEKSSKEAIFYNQRGFSQCDALRGSTLAEFLTDGDPKGDLKKNVAELQEYNPRGIELCRNLANHYSKQLFEIYKNKEDPFFLPP